MSTLVAVNTYAHSVTYVTDNILKCLKNVIRESGLSPSKLAGQWEDLQRGIKHWIESGHLEKVVLEVYYPDTDALITRWDFEVYYGGSGSGNFYVDSDQIKWAIQKAGVWPSTADYTIIATTKFGRPDVSGWSTTTLRSTDGFVKQSIGTAVEGNSLSAGASYWRTR